MSISKRLPASEFGDVRPQWALQQTFHPNSIDIDRSIRVLASESEKISKEISRKETSSTFRTDCLHSEELMSSKDLPRRGTIEGLGSGKADGEIVYLSDNQMFWMEIANFRVDEYSLSDARDPSPCHRDKNYNMDLVTYSFSKYEVESSPR